MPAPPARTETTPPEPVAAPVNPLPRDEMIDLVRCILDGDRERKAMMDRFAESTAYPSIACALLYMASSDETPEQIVDAALNYRPDPAAMAAARARMRRRHGIRD